jgi:hypothetical protein
MATNSKPLRITPPSAHPDDAESLPLRSERSGLGGRRLAAIVLILTGIGCLALALVALLRAPTSAPPLLLGDRPQVAYFEFGIGADTLYIADPLVPAERRRLMVLPHASDFGVVPALAPDGRRFAFASLPANLKAPSAETPAELWLAEIAADAEPLLIARGVDLLVPAVWSPDGGNLIFRRSRAPTPSRPGEFRLFALDVATGAERELAYSESNALFPVAVAPDGSRLYYVELGFDGSRLNATDLASGASRQIAVLSDGITRDWTLSPSGDRLAYLVMELSSGVISSRAHVLNLDTGIATPATITSDAFSPKWTSTGALVLGRASQGDAPGGLVSDSNALTLPAPTRGFDVPLAASAATGAMAVRTFDGSSAMAPGNAVLAVLTPDGARLTIASGEVTFLGWIE